MLIETRLLTLMDAIVPRPPESTIEANIGLNQLGFDSMAMVSLFVDLEDEFGLSVEAMRSCMHRACTFGALVDLCMGAAL